MTVKGDFMGSSIFVKLALIVILVANFCNWLSFTTTSWYVVDGLNDDDTHVGLWRLCKSKTVGCSNKDGTPLDIFNAVQAFAIFGFVCINVANLLVIFYMCLDRFRGNRETGMVSAILCFCAVGFWLIAIIMFGVEYEEQDLDYSFGFAICAAILAFVAGILVLLGAREGGSVTSK